MIINADTVEYGIDDDQIMFVWFGNTQIKPLEYFKIELAEEFDKQDVESGMDTYYIELNDNANKLLFVKGYNLSPSIGRAGSLFEFNLKISQLSLRSYRLVLSFGIMDFFDYNDKSL